MLQTFQVLSNFGVNKVVASGHPGFMVGDLVWGITGWEEYTLSPNPELKINHPEIPLYIPVFLVRAVFCRKQIVILNP
jgi:NADPH-dependent curcumin reductase CurA